MERDYKKGKKHLRKCLDADPDDIEGTMDSVSPEKIFGEEKDNFSSLPSQNDLVKDTS